MTLPVRVAVVKPIDDLFPDPANLRLHPPRNMEALDFSLRRWGQLKNIVALRSGRIVAGNGTWTRMKALGATHVAVVEFEDETEARAFAIADNRSSDLSTFDLPRLGAELEALRDELGLEPLSLGFTDGEMAAMLPPLEPGASGPEVHADPGIDLLAKWQTQLGDVWEAGAHRLAVGDAREPGTLEVLLSRERAQVVVTSPPYADRRTYDPASGFRPIHPDRYVLWFEPVADHLQACLAPGGSFFLNLKEHTTAGQRELYVKDLVLAICRQWGWIFVDEFCWRDARNGVPGAWPDRFKNAWEPVFHFSRGGQIKFRPDAVEGPSSFGPILPTRSGSGFTATGAVPAAAGRARPSNVLEIAAEGSVGHPAPFPSALPAFFVTAFSDPGDVVLDPFVGSGSTLIAAEKTGRRGRGVELSPLYAATALERLSLAGLQPVRKKVV